MCGEQALSKCGSQKAWHWAHAGKRHCDPWWENETDWHRYWKNLFPEETREVVHYDEVTGEKHIADIKTGRGMVIEFQHSAMSPEELASREVFYGNMIWIVDGKPFEKQFEILESQLPHPNSDILKERIFYAPQAAIFCMRAELENGESMVELFSAKHIEQQIIADYRGHHFYKWTRPREIWLNATSPVFLDFGTDELVRLTHYNPKTQRCVQRISKRHLVEKNGGVFSAYAREA